LTAKSGLLPASESRAESDSNALEVNFRRDPSIYDGQFSNNGWLQELPKPMSKLTWDNAVQIGPKMAEREGLKTDGRRQHRTERPQSHRPRLDSSRTSRSLRHRHLGYGRRAQDASAPAQGFDAYAICAPQAPSGSQPAAGSPRPETLIKLASTQGYQTMDTATAVSSARPARRRSRNTAKSRTSPKKTKPRR
jgi:hypothetical protein